MIKIDRFFSKLLNLQEDGIFEIHCSMNETRKSLVTVQFAKTISQLLSFRCRLESGVGKMWESKILANYRIMNNTNICLS